MTVQRGSLDTAARLFAAARTLLYAAGFVALWWWAVVAARPLDHRFTIAIPPWLRLPGAILIGLGVVLAFWCVAAFALVGRGTPAPFDPPRQFVAVGPYRWVRNPMYFGAVMVICGAGLWLGSFGALAVALFFIALAHAFVVLYEEPSLEDRFGQSYLRYKKTVARWLPHPPAAATATMLLLLWGCASGSVPSTTSNAPAGGLGRTKARAPSAGTAAASAPASSASSPNASSAAPSSGAASSPSTSAASSAAPSGASPTPVPEVRPGILAGYLPMGDALDSAALLPPPPADGSATKAADAEIYRTTRALRGTARWDLATQDADLTFPNAAGTFSCALGTAVTEGATPHLYQLLRRTLTDAGIATGAAKRKYLRQRPFAEMNEPSCSPNDESYLRNDGSYPSGHASLGWAWALLLTELAPDRDDAILARGFDYGQSRVICGVHWQSDVSAGRLVGSGVVARLHDDPTFRADFEAARTELESARKLGLQPSRDCGAESSALALGKP